LKKHLSKKLVSLLTAALFLTGIVSQTDPARADGQQTGREEISSIIVDPANAEPVEIAGESQFTLKHMELRDGTVRMEFRFSAHGTGIGLWSRTPYQFNETYTYSWVDPPGLEYRIDSRDIMRLISRGASPNVMITQTFSIIRDANGVYSFEFAYDYDVKGRGN
jgi:hypothetical protein